jgi:Phosphodiester glycosidase
MVPRLRTARAKARAAAVATLAALILSWGIVPPSPLTPGLLTPAPALAAISTPYLSEGRAPVAPGVQHDWGTVQTTRSGRQAVNLLEITVGTPEISLEASIGGDRITSLEKTSSQALRRSAEGHRAVAAINGDTWAGYDSPTRYAPSGVHVQAGELVTTGSVARPTFGIDASGRPMIGNVLVSAFLVWPDGTSRAIGRVNQKRTNQGLVLYTPRFGPTTPADVDGTDVVLEGIALPLAPTGLYQAVVREVRPATGGIPIAPDTVVVNGGTTSGLQALLPGDSLQLMLSITPGWEGVREAVGGREFIVRDGMTYISPRPALADQLHPRTAVGITASGDLVMATVDGRQNNHSTGVDLPELAELMLSRGAVQALNMDGGGSTTMAVRLPGDPEVTVVNQPSDGRERAVANSLVVVSSAPTGPLALIGVTPGTASLWQGEVATFTAKGQDAAYNGVDLPLGEVAWGVVGPGTINSAGRFTATEEGAATVTATARGVQGIATVTVRLDSFPPVARAPTAALVAGTGLGTSTIPVRVSWAAATDVGRGVVGYELERSVAGAWSPVSLAKPTSTSVTLGLTPGQVNRFRVRAIDRAGNVGAWATARAFRLGVAQEISRSVVRKGRWATRLAAQYYGGRVIAATAAGASARITVTGQQIAWVSAVGPTRGQARVYVDGAYVRTVDLRSAASLPRRVVYVRSWAAPGRHTLEIRVVGTSGRPRVDLDAFVAIVPAS